MRHALEQDLQRWAPRPQSSRLGTGNCRHQRDPLSGRSVVLLEGYFGCTFDTQSANVLRAQLVHVDVLFGRRRPSPSRVRRHTRLTSVS